MRRLEIIITTSCIMYSVCICSWWWDVHICIYFVSSIVFVDFLIKSSFKKMPFSIRYYKSKFNQFLRLFTIIKLLILIQSFYFTHILHFSESLVYNRFYIVYDYNHYNIVYDNQCSIYSGTNLSISNFEWSPFDFFTTAGASHYYT